MKNKLLIFGLCGMLFSQTACDNYDDLIPQEYNTILSMKQAGEKDIILYKTGENTIYEIVTQKNGAKPTNTATADVEVMNAVDFAEYLAKTGKSYKMLPANCYSLSDNNLDFSSDETWKKVPLSINTDAIEAFLSENTEDEYVIPIAMVSATDSVLATKNNLILKPSVLVPSISYSGVQNSATSREIEAAGGVISIPLALQITNLWDFQVKIEVDEGMTTLDNISLENDGLVDFRKGENGTLKINVSRMSQVAGHVGLKIKEIMGKDGFNYTEQPLDLSIIVKKYPLTTSMLETNAQEPSEGPLSNILDGDISTFFHSAWSVGVEGNHYVQINLPENINRFVFSYTNRQANGNAALAWFDLMGSTDGVNFELIKNYAWDADGLPSGGAGVFTSKEVVLSKPMKSFRYVCNGNWTGGVFFVWSEFSMHAM